MGTKETAPKTAAKTTRKKTTGRKRPIAGKATVKKVSKKAAGTNIVTAAVNAERRHEMIAEAAYLRAERRGFADGDPVEDWLDAEREIDETLKKLLDSD